MSSPNKPRSPFNRQNRPMPFRDERIAEQVNENWHRWRWAVAHGVADPAEYPGSGRPLAEDLLSLSQRRARVKQQTKKEN